MKRLLLIIGFIFFTICVVVGIYITAKDDNRYGTYHKVIKELKQDGFSVTESDTKKDILEGERKWLTINQTENIAIYIYGNNQLMEEDAGRLSKEGSKYNTGKQATFISWSNVPHFYKKGNLIVLYVGEDLEIINSLEEILGLPFAGYSKTAKKWNKCITCIFVKHLFHYF